MAVCRSSRLLPETRTDSPWMEPLTFILESFSSLTIFLATSVGTPWRTVIFCFILSPPIFSGLASSR